MTFALHVCIFQVTGEKHDKDEKDPAFEGLYFNYFSVGLTSVSICLLWSFMTSFSLLQ